MPLSNTTSLSRARLILAALSPLLLLSLSCSSKEAPVEEDVPPPAQDTASTSPEAEAQIAWGAFASHPAREELERCHLLRREELAILHVALSSSPSKGPSDEALMTLYAASGPEGESAFERERRLVKLRERFAAEAFSLLSSSSLCVEYELPLLDYDFQRKAFPLLTSKGAILCPGCDTSAPSSSAFVLRSSDLPAQHAMSPDSAEALLEATLPAIKAPEAPEATTPTTPSSTQAGATTERTRDLPKDTFPMLFYLQHAEREQVQAWVFARTSSNTSPTPKQDPPPQTAPSTPSLMQELRSHPRLIARALLSLDSATTESLPGDPSSARIPIFLASVDALVYLDRHREAIEVLPSTETLARAEHSMNVESFQSLVEVVCQGDVSTRSRTAFRDGKLIEEKSYSCRACPQSRHTSGARGPLSMNASRALSANFLSPWRPGALLRASGCGADLVDILVEADLFGELVVRALYPNLPQACQPITSSTPDAARALLLCQRPHKERSVEELELVALRGDELAHARPLGVWTGEESFECGGDRSDAELVGASMQDRDGDGLLDITIELKLLDGGCDGESHTLTWLAIQSDQPSVLDRYQPDGATNKLLATHKP